MNDGPSLNHWRNRVAWRLANLVLRIATRDYRLRLKGAILYGLSAVMRDFEEGREPPPPFWRSHLAGGEAERHGT